MYTRSSKGTHLSNKVRFLLAVHTHGYSGTVHVVATGPSEGHAGVPGVQADGQMHGNVSNTHVYHFLDVPGPPNAAATGPWCANACIHISTCTDFSWSWPRRFCQLVVENGHSGAEAKVGAAHAADDDRKPLSRFALRQMRLQERQQQQSTGGSLLVHQAMQHFHGDAIVCSKDNPMVTASSLTVPDTAADAAPPSSTLTGDPQSDDKVSRSKGASGVGSCFPASIETSGNSGAKPNGSNTTSSRRVRWYGAFSINIATASPSSYTQQVCKTLARTRKDAVRGQDGTLPCPAEDLGRALAHVGPGEYEEYNNRIRGQALCAVKDMRRWRCENPTEVALVYDLWEPIAVAVCTTCVPKHAGWIKPGQFALNPLLPSTGMSARVCVCVFVRVIVSVM